MISKSFIGIKELQQICGVNTPQVMLQYVKANLERINADGIHAEKVGKSWAFDDIAVQRIRELRNITSHSAVEVLNDGKLQELTEENNQLKTRLLMAQNLVNERLEKIILLQDEAMQGVKLLSAAQTEEAKAKFAAERLKDEVESLRLEKEELRQELAEATAKAKELVTAKLKAETELESIKQELNMIQEQNARLKALLQQEREKGIFDKLLGR